MKKSLKIIGSIILVFVALSIVFYVGFRIYITMNSEDEPLKDDSYLIPKIVNVSDEENSWFDLKKAEEVMYYPEDKEELIGKMANGEEWDEDFAQEIIEKNQEAYRHIEIASRKNHYANPTFQKIKKEEYDYELVIESVSFIRKLSRIHLIYAASDIRSGDIESGVGKIISYINIVEKVDQNPSPTLIEYLVALASKGIVTSSIENIFVDRSLSKNYSIVLQENLEKIKTNNDGAVNAFKGEYLVLKNGISSIAVSNLGDVALKLNEIDSGNHSSFYLKPNKTKNLLMVNFAEPNIERSVLSCENITGIEDVKYDLKNIAEYIFSENAIGEILVNMVNDSFEGLQKKRCVNSYNILAVQIQLASNAYKKDNGEYPKNLGELIESGYFVADVPEKIYGQDIIYDKNTGKLIYPEDLR